MSIRRQFVLALAAFAVLLAVAFGWTARAISSQALEAELERRLLDVAGAAAATGLDGDVAAGLEPGFEDTRAFQAYSARLGRMRTDGYVSDAWIFRGRTRENLVSADSTIAIGRELLIFEPWDAEIRRAIGDGRATTPVFPDSVGRLYKYGFIKFDNTPNAILAVLMPADFLVPIGRLSRSLAVGTLIATVLAVGLGMLLARGIARPVEHLSRAAIRIQRGRMDRPVHLDRHDELGKLADAMERMRNGILERDEQLRLMLAQVAHEIRNPLGGLELFASAAAESDDPDERRQHMKRVRAEVAGLNRIIDDFLTFARPLQPDPEPIDLRDPVETALALVRGEFERDGGELQVELPDEPLVARADPGQVKRAILNLVRNAAQVSDRVGVRAWLERGEAVVSVADDGPGVPDDERDRIFDPFVTDKEQGAGLGLAIVRKVAEAHGGRVEVRDAAEDGVGTGAEFRVYLSGMEDFPGG